MKVSIEAAQFIGTLMAKQNKRTAVIGYTAGKRCGASGFRLTFNKPAAPHASEKHHGITFSFEPDAEKHKEFLNITLKNDLLILSDKRDNTTQPAN